MPVEQSSAVELLKRIHLFRGIDEQKLYDFVQLMEEIEFPAGSVIFEEGNPPDFFYFIYAGRVRLRRDQRNQRTPASLGILDEDDYFGQEVLDVRWPRQVTAEAHTDVTLLRLSIDNFTKLVKILPVLGQRLQLILDSYRLMLKKRFGWIEPEEAVYYIARRHVFFLWLHILPPILIGLVISLLLAMSVTSQTIAPVCLGTIELVLLGWFIWALIDWSNDYNLVTSQRVVNQEKVVLLYDSRQESLIEQIQSASISTTQIGRILGYGNLAIRTYIGTILFKEINRPELVMALIQEQQTRAQSSQRKVDLRAMETTIEGRIGISPQSPPPKPQPGPVPSQPGFFQRHISDLLHLRIEVGGTVIYRTHWFILLKKIGVPLLLLSALVVLSLARTINLYTFMPLQAVCGLNGLLGLGIFAWLMYQYFDWHNDVYLITADQIVDVNKKPLGREERRAAPIKNILSIEYKRLGIIGLLLNFGTVYIRVGDQQFTFDDVYNPSAVQRELFHHLATKTFSEKQAQAAEERKRMADWIAAYHRVTRGGQPPPNTPPNRGEF